MIKSTSYYNKFKNRNVDEKVFHEEYQYINLMKDIIQYGSMEHGRNGNVKTVIGSAMHFSLQNNQIPILTTKKTAWKTCFKELLWFIRGDTDNNKLNDVNVHIWDGNSSKDFLSSRGLDHYEDGDLGPIYGFQWRHFNADYKGKNMNYENCGVDQLNYVIAQLKNPETRNNRRLIVSAWNPCQLDEMALPPCHVMFQFNVTQGNKLSCSLYQRSVDCALGQPFNICSYALLTHLIAHHCDLEADEFITIWEIVTSMREHIPPIQEQIERDPFPFPSIKILNKRSNISDYTMDDFELIDYHHHSQIKMKMVV